MTSLLPVVLNIAPHEKRQAERLVQYVKQLDGTEVITMSFQDPPGMRYPEVANWAFKQCAKAMRGKAFFWLECDSIPTKKGWLKEITDEYAKQGKPYLYPKTRNPPFDNFTGIGVQGPDAYEQAPDGFTTGGFDEWISTRFADQIGFTDLIQHSYGFYDSKGDAELHEFPRDLNILREDSVIFHKDQQQGLIDHLMPSMKREEIIGVSSVGDLGDCTVSLATLNHRGGLYDYYLRDNGATKGIVSRISMIRPLIEAQPYINTVKIWKRESIAWASEGFRPSWHDKRRNLATCHAQHALDTHFIDTLPDMSKPWLTVEPNKKFNDFIIINRSPRYNNPHFPWRQIVEHYGKLLCFIGLPQEHADFEHNFGKVRYIITNDMLEVAQVIAGSELFIGNQSSCMTIAEGLKHPRILEGSLLIPDCIYPKAHNAQYVFDGTVTLPATAHIPAKSLKSNAIHWSNFDTTIVPKVGRGYGWIYDHGGTRIQEGTVRKVAFKVARLLGISQEQAEEEVVKATVKAAPNSFSGNLRMSNMAAAIDALRENGYTDHPVFDLTSGNIADLL